MADKICLQTTPKCQKIGCRHSHYGGRLRLSISDINFSNIKFCCPNIIDTNFCNKFLWPKYFDKDFCNKFLWPKYFDKDFCNKFLWPKYFDKYFCNKFL